MKPHKMVSVRMVEMTLLENLELELQPETAAGPVLCDQCSARAGMQVILPYGELWFCLHHYNDHADALTKQGAIAKLLSVSRD
jgi:hypothetical protein